MATLAELSGSPAGVLATFNPLAPAHQTLEMKGMVRVGDFSNYASPRSDLAAKCRDAGLDAATAAKCVEVFEIDERRWRDLQTRVWSHARGPFRMNARQAADAVGNVGLCPLVLLPATLLCGGACIARGLCAPFAEPYAADAAARHAVFLTRDGVVVPGGSAAAAAPAGGARWRPAPAVPETSRAFVAYGDLDAAGLELRRSLDVGVTCAAYCRPCSCASRLEIDNFSVRSVLDGDVDVFLAGYRQQALLHAMIVAGTRGLLATPPAPEPPMVRTAAAAADPAAARSPIKSRLEELDDLLDFSVITRAEYDEQRAAIFAAAAAGAPKTPSRGAEAPAALRAALASDETRLL